jgi:hypothetical protein
MSGGGKNAALGRGELGYSFEKFGLIGFDDQEVVGLVFLDEALGR